MKPKDMQVARRAPRYRSITRAFVSGELPKYLRIGKKRIRGWMKLEVKRHCKLDAC